MKNYINVETHIIFSVSYQDEDIKMKVRLWVNTTSYWLILIQMN